MSDEDLARFEGDELTVFFTGALTGTAWGRLERVETRYQRGWSVVCGGYVYLKFSAAQVAEMGEYPDNGRKYLGVKL